MSCLCHIHVEANILRCGLLRKQFAVEKEGNTEATDNEDHEPIENVKIYQRLSHMVDDTLCPKGDNEYHKLVWLKRECSECGVQAANFSISELNNNSNNDSVRCKWSKYGYNTLEGCETADGTPRKKLSIVSKETSPSELVNYLKQLLQSYPYHQFMSCWKKSQFDSLKENLLIDNVLCVHDYSENYECSYQEEVQSQYFSKTEASIHVTILYRHASQEFDNCASTEEQPKTIKEYILSFLMTWPMTVILFSMLSTII